MIGNLSGPISFNSLYRNRLKGYCMVKLLFVRYILLLIKYIMDWGLIPQNCMGKLTYIDIIHSREFFHDDVIFFT